MSRRGVLRIVAAIMFALAAGSMGDRWAAAAPGDLDASFGTGGRVTTDFGGGDGASAVAIQTDGKIVAVGASNGRFALARYNVDGSLDASFDSDGLVTTDFGPGTEFAFTAAIQPDGRIVAAGTAAPGGFCCQFALARYNSDGSLDATFGIGGKVTTLFSGDTEARSVAIQPDGRIVVVGFTYSPFFDSFAAARYNANGTLDVGFGSSGRVTTDFGGNDQANAVVIQLDGKIVAVGVGGAPSDFALARYNPDGSLDTAFDGDGKVKTDFGSFDGAMAAAVQPDGRIIAAGQGGPSADFALARYNTNGGLDPRFGIDGRVTTSFSFDSATSVAIQTNGKVIAAGWQSSDLGPTFALARYNTDGSLDAGFGTGGKVTTDFGFGEERASGLAIQVNGRVVVAGTAAVGGLCCDFALSR